MKGKGSHNKKNDDQTKPFDPWKTILVMDDNQNEIKKYELDEKEKLIEKMERRKKRKLSKSILSSFNYEAKANSNPPKGINNSNMTLEHQFIFSYDNSIASSNDHNLYQNTEELPIELGLNISSQEHTLNMDLSSNEDLFFDDSDVLNQSIFY